MAAFLNSRLSTPAMSDEQRMAMQHQDVTGPLRYVLVFAALLVLLALTVAADQFPMGTWNTVVAIAIAFAKAALIVTFFMHLYGSPRIVKAAAGAGLLWLSIAIALVMADDVTRGWHNPLPSATERDVSPRTSDRLVPGPQVRPTGRLTVSETVHEASLPD